MLKLGYLSIATLIGFGFLFIGYWRGGDAFIAVGLVFTNLCWLAAFGQAVQSKPKEIV